MKQLLLFLFFLTLTVSVAMAQVTPTPIAPPFIVQKSAIGAVPINPIITGDDPILNLEAVCFDIAADSSSVRITDLSCIVYIEINYDKPVVSSIGLYDGTTLLSAQSSTGNRYDFADLDIVVTAYTKKTLSLRFQEIIGDGSITAKVSDVAGTDRYGTYYMSPDWVWGERLNFVDPRKTDLVHYRSPIADGWDTLSVYPGQYWYLYEACYTAPHNWLPQIITVAEMTANNADELPGEKPAFYIQDPWIYDDTLGTPISEYNYGFNRFRWYSNYAVGVDAMNNFSRWGYNYLPVGNSYVLWSYASLIYYSPFFADGPREKTFSSNITLQSVDGVRGDVSGDGYVTDKDFELMVRGQQTQEEMYHHNTVDFGRGLILFSWPTSIDTWLINVWLHTPDDLLVRDLGIGQLMSARTTPPQIDVNASTTISGKTMTVKTKGFAVGVATILHGGQAWNQAVRVVNGEAKIELPDVGLKYIVEAVSLPGKVTGVEEKTDIPTKFNLNQNYPNPFNPTTTIDYSLPQAGLAKLTVYNTLGQEVAVLVNNKMSAGRHQVKFNAGKFTSGTYFYRLVSGNFTSVKKMMLVK